MPNKKQTMPLDINYEVAAMQKLTAGQLQEKYAEVHGETARSRNRIWLIRRIAWKLQALAEGGLSERARKRAMELADETDVRLTPPKAITIEVSNERLDQAQMTDSRLPEPGTTLIRKYKGNEFNVHVKPDGFEYQGELYKSLSAVAKAITGSHTNGFRFFKLGGQR